MSEEVQEILRREREERERRLANEPPAFYLRSDWRKNRQIVVSERTGKKMTKTKEESKEESNVEDNTQVTKKRGLSCRQKRIAWIAGTLATATAVTVGKIIYDNNMTCRTVERALELGWNLETHLAIPENVYSNLKTLNGYMESKSEIDKIAYLYTDNAEDVCACKIASLLGIGPNDVYFKYGLTSLKNKPVSYIQIGDVIYTKGESEGENRHKVDDKIIDCIDNIVKIQEITEYYDYSPMYDSEKDDDEIYKELEDAVKQLNETAACIFKIDEKGNIVAEIIKGKPQQEETKNANQKDDELEIGD